MEYNAPDLKLKERAREALDRFLSSDTPASISSPILLLNYLHQHSIISQPIYETISKKTSGNNHFIVTCKINDAITVGQGTSKKTAKTSAAQQQLNLLLSDDISMGTDFSNKLPSDSFCVNALSLDDVNPHPHVNYELLSCYESSPIQVESGSPQVEKFYLDDLSNIYSFDSKENTKLNTLDPQGPSWEMANETLTESKISETVASMSYFDPFASMKVAQQGRIRTWPTKSTDQSKVVQIERLKSNNAVPTLNYVKINSENWNTDTRTKGENSVEFRITDNKKLFPSEKHNDAQSSKMCTTDVEKENTTCVKGASDIELENSSVNSVSYSTHVSSVDDYFDPFVKLRPTSAINTRSSDGGAENLRSSCEEITNTDNIVMTDSSIENCGKLEKPKSPFAILKEKSFKMFKLIPRCHIEENESGFKCTVVISTYTCVGEGSSKKLAKMNAAAIMLEEIEKSQPFNVQ